MKESLIKDVLSWEKFYEESTKRDSYPPKEIKLFNRLVSHTNNFFVISAIGAFTPGYLMLVTKKLLPSFGMIEDQHLDELKWLIEVISKALIKTYKRETVIFEHGMCACVGGLDRAHLHMMTIDSSFSDDLIKDSINKVLIRRKAGIESVEINGHKLENIHDILEVMNSSDVNSYKINGSQLFYEDISNNLDVSNWPISTRPHVRRGGHYVYFKTKSSSSSFLTDKNFQTQLGRQIIFETEIKKNLVLRTMYEKIIKENEYANVWKWQEFSFKQNMLKTMNDLVPALQEIKNDHKNKIFNFQTFKKNN